MILRILMAFGILSSLPAEAGWQGFQKQNFNTGHPWKYEPDAGYVSFLNGQVRWQEVSLMAPYSSFGFAFRSACHNNWRDAWVDITHNHCQSNTWGPVEKKCTRDLFVVLPCESEVLGMSREELASYAKGFEDFLASEGERKQSQALNNKYATMALERVTKIYSAFHERKAFEKQEAYQESIRSKIGAQFTEAMKEIESKRRLKVAFDRFTREFLALTEQKKELLDLWSHFKNVRLQEEKLRLAGYNTELSARMIDAQLNWENFRSNERTLLGTAAALDKDVIAWEQITSQLSDYHSQLANLLASFKASSQDDFWTAADSERDSLLSANHKYIQNVASMLDMARKRATELRRFREQYVSMLQTYQNHYVERIALHEKNLYTEARKELELQKVFSENILRLTTPVHEKASKADALNIPFLYQRYQTLVKIVDQRYLCVGELDKWKKDACDIGLRNIAIAENDLKSLKNRTFHLYTKILLNKAESFQIDAQRLKLLTQNSENTSFEESLRVYDAILLETNAIAKSRQVQP